MIYDWIVPTAVGSLIWGVYSLLEPAPKVFGDDGILRFTRDFLIMAVPFMIGALATVAMASPSPHLDARPRGAPLYLDGQMLSLRQFVCHLLGYLSFVGLWLLLAAVGASLLRSAVLSWVAGHFTVLLLVHAAGMFLLAQLIAFLLVTVFWALYFLADVVNRDAVIEQAAPITPVQAPPAPTPITRRRSS